MLTRELAEFVVYTRVKDLPSGSLELAHAAVVDTMGVAIAGSLEPVAIIARDYAARLSGGVSARLWGTRASAPEAEAAFANAVSGHALDFDDSLPSLRGHPSVPLCAAGFAAATVRPVSGEDFLAAYVVSLETVGQIGRALGHEHYRAGWHITATAGAFSSTVMAGRLMGLDVNQIRHALGIAATQTAGLVRNFGSMAKSLQAGQAARTGVVSALLAQAGMTADPDIFDGEGGVLAVYGPVKQFPGRAATWEINEPGIYVKRWPCCYANHRALAGIFTLCARHAIDPFSIKEIAVGFLPDADKALIYTDAQNGLQGKFSIEYCAAAAILDGAIGLDSFTDEAVRRPDVQALMRRVRRFAMPGEGSFSGVVGFTDVEITTASGRHAIRIEHTPGSPLAPMTASDRRGKFIDCANRAIGAERAAALLSRLEAMADLDDVCSLLEGATP